MREYATAPGQRAMVRLPDGSQVTLSVASRLRYPESFPGAARREIHLEGEAVFEVKHDSRRPFVVHSGDAVTEDLGTTFSVRAYPTDTAVRVVVTEGSVELRARRLPAGRRGVVLVAGQLGELNRNGNTVVRSEANASRYLAWRDGRLTIDDTPLRIALPELSRWYDLHFVLHDPTLGNRILTASFGGDSVTQTLDLVAAALDARYERVGRTVTWYAKSRAR